MFIIVPIVTLLVCLAAVGFGLALAYGGTRLYRAGQTQIWRRLMGAVVIILGVVIAGFFAVETVKTVAFTVDFFHLI